MSLRRRLASEALGSVLLAATVIGSGVMAERLAAGNAALALLANTAATVDTFSLRYLCGDSAPGCARVHCRAALGRPDRLTDSA